MSEVTSSKKSKLETTWSDIINTLKIAEHLKPYAIDCFIKSGSTKEYIKQNEYVRASLCMTAGIEGWQEQVYEAIIDANEGLPSPSAMTVDKIDLILVDEISESDSEFSQYISNEENKDLNELCTVVKSNFSHTTEADSSVRVIAVLFCLFKELADKKVLCKSQPTVIDHPIFTDFLIVLSSSTKIALIEVKKPELTCNFRVKTKAVAQALRKAHIMLMDRKDVESLILILTNAIDWSFAFVKRQGEKIVVTSTLHYNIASFATYSNVYSILKKYFTLS